MGEIDVTIPLSCSSPSMPTTADDEDTDELEPDA